MPVGLGHKAVLGIGEESTYGTPVTRTKFLELVGGGDGLVVDEEKIESQSMKEIGVRGDYEVQQGSVDVKGTVTFEVPYDGAEKIFKHAFGSVATSQPDSGADPLVYQHIFTMADALPTGLTLEVDRDVTAFVYEGCKIASIEFSCGGPDELVRVAAEVIGEDVQTGSATSPTVPAVGFFSAPQADLKWNSTSVPVSAFSVKLNNNLDKDRRFLGSRLRKEPTRAGGKVEVTGTFKAEFESTTHFNDFRNATNRALQIKCTGPGIGAASRKYELTLDCAVTKLIEYPVTAENEGRIMVEVSFKAYRNATEKELKLTLQNLVSSV